MMKTNYIKCALIALLAISCTKEEQQPLQTEQSLIVSASVEQPDGGTKTTLEGLNVKWTVGDQIYLTDGTNYAIYQATTNSTTTSFSYVSGSGTFGESTDVYAYYPAGNLVGDTPFDNATKSFTATIPSNQPYAAGGFSDGINPMTAKATVTSGALALSFKNVMAFVKLQIADSANDEKILTSLSLSSPSTNLCGTATVTVADGGTASAAIATGTKSIEVAGINATLSTIAAPVYIAVPADALGNLTITASTSESTGEYTQTKTASNPLTPARSSINTYNPMQISSFTGKTSRAEAPANCYMIDAASRTSIIIPLSQAEAGWDAIKTLETSDTFDKTKITSGTRTIAVRWMDGASGTITLSAINDLNMALSLTDCSNGTNAVVDLKNGSEIVWSWHLWFTDYKPGADQEHTVKGQVHTYSGAAFQSGGLYEGKVMMDRNLGATVTGVSGAISQPSTEAEAQEYWGLFYQFGRKDPFANGISVIDVTTNPITYATAAQNPNKFYYNPDSSSSWSSTDASASPMTNPWNSNSTKSAFDPCPAGWRIPNNGPVATNNVWTGMTAATWQAASDKNGGQLWSGAWIPAAGFRSTNGGSLLYRGKQACYWSSSPNTVGKGYYCVFGSDFVGTANSSGRASGFSVRCVNE